MAYIFSVKIPAGSNHTPLALFTAPSPVPVHIPATYEVLNQYLVTGRKRTEGERKDGKEEGVRQVSKPGKEKES